MAEGALAHVPLAHELLADELQRFLQHLQVERRLASRTLAMYREALARLQRLAAAGLLATRPLRAHQANKPRHAASAIEMLRAASPCPRSAATQPRK